MIRQLMIVLAFLTASATAGAATIGSNPATSNVLLGDVFNLEVIGTGFPVTQGGGFTLDFDPAVLQANSVSIDGAVWNFVNDTGSIDNGVGTVSAVLVSAFTGVAGGDFTVAAIEFQAIAVGQSGINLSEVAANLWASDGSLIDPTFDSSGLVNVAEVPVPAGVWLFGSALLALFGTRVR